MCAKLSAAGCDGLECLRSAPYHRPEDVLRAVQQLNPAFQGYAQQDAQEFLRCVLDNIHEELRREVPGAQHGLRWTSTFYVVCVRKEEVEDSSHAQGEENGGRLRTHRRFRLFSIETGEL